MAWFDFGFGLWVGYRALTGGKKKSPLKRVGTGAEVRIGNKTQQPLDIGTRSKYSGGLAKYWLPQREENDVNDSFAIAFSISITTFLGMDDTPVIELSE